MVDNISFRQSPRGEPTGNTNRIKPQAPPRNDQFRKSLQKRHPSKEEKGHSAAIEEQDEAPSLFDLSRSTQSKNKSSFTSKSSLKDSASSELAPNRPITAKEGRGESQDQDSESNSDFFAAKEKSEIANNKTPPPPAAENQYATADEPVEEQFQTTEMPQPDSQIKKPVDDQAQPMNALQQKQAAAAAAALHRPQKVKESDKETSFETSNLGQTSKKQKTGKSEGSKSEGTTEAKGDATGAVSASIQSAAFHTEKTQESQESIRSTTIQELATQIIDRIQIMRKGDETQTTITLRHPPVLEGATITLTTSDHAKREFNIAFANLSPDAKLLLDRKLKEDSLTETLERKGIIVNTLTTSTQSETLLTADASQASRDRQDQQQQQRQQQQKNFQDEEGEGVS